jgi:hypothetical protein
MRRIFPGAAIIFISLFLSCEKNYNLNEYMIGKWAVTGNKCKENGSCKDTFKFHGKDYYNKNYGSTVLEFKKGGLLYQPILGEGKFEGAKNSMKLGINLEGRTVWKSSQVIVIGKDRVLLKFGKVWRKYRRIK